MFKKLKFPHEFFLNNRKKLINKIEDNCVVFILSNLCQYRNGDQEFDFRQDSNFFYYTGLNLSRAILAIVKIEDQVETILFYKKRDIQLEKWIGSDPSDEEIYSVSKIKDIRNLDDLNLFYDLCFKKMNINKIYLYNERYSSEVIPTYTQFFALNLKKKYPFVAFKALNHLVDTQRVKKHKVEVKMIRRAIAVTELGIKDVLKNLKPGTKENDYEAILSYNYQKNECIHGFRPVLAGGKNSTIIHYGDNNSRLKENDLLLIDTGAEYQNYSADVSRTYPVKGHFSKNKKEIYQILLEIQKEIIKMIRPGIFFSDLEEKALKEIYKFLKKFKFISNIRDIDKYYYHKIGHFMGLDVHDVGNFSKPLEKGNIITIEPGIYIPEKGFGIRIEDDILIYENGYEVLTKNIPKEIDEIEKIMCGK